MTKEKKLKTKYTGVRYYEHSTRKLLTGDFDRYYSIRYTSASKACEEGLGWASEGWSAEKAHSVRARAKRPWLKGEGPESPSEMRVKAAGKTRIEGKASGLTIADFFRDFMIPRLQNEKRSWLIDCQRFTKSIEPHLGHLPLEGVTRNQIQNFLDSLVARGLAPGTVRQYMGIVRRLFNMAAETQVGEAPVFTGQNPAKGIRLPAVRNGRDRFLTGEEAERLLSASLGHKNTDLHDAMVLSLNTGLRLGELCRLIWLDIDFDSGMISVREEAQRKPGGKIPLNAAAEAVLRGRKGSAAATDLVFPPVFGQHLQVNLSYEFRRLADKVGLNKGLAADDRQRRVVFHTLRHTFASWLALAGVDIYRIKTLMRHKTIDMTMRYAHLIPDATRQAVYDLTPPKKPLARPMS